MRRARRIIAMYEAEGVDRSRVLVKLAGTWEGRDAPDPREGRHHLQHHAHFGFAQGVAAAQAGAQLISPSPAASRISRSDGGERRTSPTRTPASL